MACYGNVPLMKEPNLRQHYGRFVLYLMREEKDPERVPMRCRINLSRNGDLQKRVGLLQFDYFRYRFIKDTKYSHLLPVYLNTSRKGRKSK